MQAPPPPAEPEQEFELVKVGVPWRGDYPRLMVVGNDRVSTLDPTTRRETNGWSASGVVRVEAVREANRVLIHLGVGVAPWQRVTLATADVETADAVLASLEAMAVPVSRASSVSENACIRRRSVVWCVMSCERGDGAQGCLSSPWGAVERVERSQEVVRRLTGASTIIRT